MALALESNYAVGTTLDKTFVLTGELVHKMHKVFDNKRPTMDTHNLALAAYSNNTLVITTIFTYILSIFFYLSQCNENGITNFHIHRVAQMHTHTHANRLNTADNHWQ